jgi:hypothetical protein
MNQEIELSKRKGIIEKCMNTISLSDSKKKPIETLLTVNRLLYGHPDFISSGTCKQVDTFVSMAISKIHFGILESIPPKAAIEQAFKYLAQSISLIDQK